ncbi:Fas apoptotic inhibitory molecule 1 [Aphelenchoides bicaudatus]|nr:Fas apoptotic inhibitory molecule 1 [Aphelenchoides bicaudatus]
MDSDLVAVWNIPLSDKMYKIEFEHGTTTGKRVIPSKWPCKFDEIVRHDWLFKLVGRECFEIKSTRCTITIEAIGIFAYEYSIQVGGKTYEKFKEQQQKGTKSLARSIGKRKCSKKDSMDIWVNGKKVNTTGVFVDDGTETHFEIGDNLAYIKSESSGKRSQGIVYNLFVNGELVQTTV